MIGYKVTFEQNKAVSATRLENTYQARLVQLGKEGGKRSLQWLVVYGADEHDAIKIADDIVKDYKGFFS